MHKSGERLCIAVAACALTLALAVPAAAQSSGESAGVAKRSRAQVAQSRTSVTIYPRYQRLHPNAKRHCEAWLREEHRPSGTVVTPQMRCWWQ